MQLVVRVLFRDDLFTHGFHLFISAESRSVRCEHQTDIIFNNYSRKKN